MSQYYNSKREKNVFNPKVKEPYKLSRSKIEDFLKCPRCFYFDRRLGIGQPPGFPFSLNSAVDKLLKKEFDIHRTRKTTHPLMEAYGIKAIPYEHEKINLWRDPLKGGISHLHKKTNLILYGGVDDLWINPLEELMVVDYKATAKDGEVGIEAEWQKSYKRQIEIYQWLFRQNNFKVSSIGYFVYVNGRTDKEAFDGKLEFDVKIIPYQGNDSWIEKTLIDAKKCLMNNKAPASSPDCDYCRYIKAVKEIKK